MTATKLLVFLLTAICLVCLAAEQVLAARHRRALGHVVYVNGTRGKSTVTRLIDAGLRAGGLRVFCKTTGTLPMTLGTDGVERPIVRRGRANIKEQLAILRQAAAQRADVLVIECMAVDPALQAVSQHRMLKADLGVITNVRLDHTAEMGATLEEICDSLCNTIPRGGRLFTADADFVGQIEKNARPLGCEVILAQPRGELPAFDFPENLALALEVCMALGVGRETALDGMSRYQPDPYALSLHRFSSGAIFVNGMSINDPQSTALVADRLTARADLADRRL
ncbi:MAG: poly-gamma-glutamate synthase PgsB, partial [Oscillospiraceae bacterium]